MGILGADTHKVTIDLKNYPRCDVIWWPHSRAAWKPANDKVILLGQYIGRSCVLFNPVKPSERYHQAFDVKLIHLLEFSAEEFKRTVFKCN